MAISTSFKQECPSCEGLVLIKDPKLVGKKIECPKCKFKFVVKEPPPKEEEVAKDEEGITSKPSKKPKTVRRRQSHRQGNRSRPARKKRQGQ